MNKLKFIGNRTEGSKITLIQIDGNIYCPDSYVNPLSYLKKGCILWIKKDDDSFNVYELTEDMDKTDLKGLN